MLGVGTVGHFVCITRIQSEADAAHAPAPILGHAVQDV